ncbi:hypothetical protein [Desulfotalea psychrophila]|uniref:hypothetical protein n=1 Tax=Desulfotalea psychrophila TaxID=84980 RepID=UPI0002DC568D|nr:hypothetical protein [Desulfotalea psychrophila]
MQLQREFPQLEIEYIEVTTAPIKTVRAGVFMIPSIQGRSGTLSGIFLPEEKIHAFLKEEYRYNQ